jgi:hypothetical protein
MNSTFFSNFVEILRVGNLDVDKLTPRQFGGSQDTLDAHNQLLF